MRKLSLLLVLLLTSSAGFAQVSWTGNVNSTTTVTGGFYRSDAPSTALPGTTSATFTSTATAGTLSGTYEQLAASARWQNENGPSYGTYGNLGLIFSNNDGGSMLSLSANTYFWNFTVPETTTGHILGYTVLNDPYAIASDFNFSFNGSGGLTVTQTGAFDIDPNSSKTLSIALNNVAAVPEPATTAALFALVAGVAVAVRRRRRTKII